MTHFRCYENLYIHFWVPHINLTASNFSLSFEDLNGFNMSVGCNLVQSQTHSRCQRRCQQDFEAARPLPRRKASTHDLVQTWHPNLDRKMCIQSMVQSYGNFPIFPPHLQKHSMARKQTTSYHAGHQTEGCTSFWGRVAQRYRETIYIYAGLNLNLCQIWPCRCVSNHDLSLPMPTFHFAMLIHSRTGGFVK